MRDKDKPRLLRRTRNYQAGPVAAPLFALHKLSLSHKLPSLALSILAWAAGLYFTADYFGVSSNFFVIIPVVMAALCFGLTGGMVAGALGLPANLLVYGLLGHPEYSPASKVLAELSGVFLGAVLGFLADYFSAMQQEIERRRETEAFLLHTLDEKSVLLRELLHRVKNNLNVMQSLIRLQASRSKSPAFKEAADLLVSRIHAISLVQDWLYLHDDLSGITAREFLEGLAGNIVSGFSALPVELLVVVEPEDLSLSVETATPLGLIVNEIVTNALKHAFPPPTGESARIELSFKAVNEEFRLEIADNGKGFAGGKGIERPAEGEGPNGGLGLTLVAALASQLYASYAISGEVGCRFEMSFPRIPPVDLAPPDAAR